MYITDINKIESFKERLTSFNYRDKSEIQLMLQMIDKEMESDHLTSELANKLKKERLLIEKLNEKLPIRCQAIIIKDNKILFLKCLGLRLNDIFYTLPGGAVHHGETLIEALHREMDEEIGTTVVITTKLPRIYDYSDDDFYLEYETFVCELKNDVPKSFDANEVSTKILELVWLDIDDLGQLADNDDYYFHTVPLVNEIPNLLRMYVSE